MLLRRALPAPRPAALSGLPAYIAWADRQIGRVVVAEHLHAALTGVTEGPTVLTFRLRLLRDATRANISRLLSLDAAIAHALHVAAVDVRLQSTAEGILLQLPHPQPWTPTVAQLAASPSAYHGSTARLSPQVTIGLDDCRRPVSWNLAASPHLLAVGPTQRGKTEAVKSILALLSLDAQPGQFAFVVLAKKAANWQAMSQTATCIAVLTDPAEQERYARWLATRLDERTASAQRDPMLVTVIDDAHDIASTADLIGPLQRVAGLGAAAGLYLFATTQSTGRRGGVGDLEHNFATRLVFGAADAAAAARFAGSGGTGADRVGRTKGDALLIVDGQPQRVATAYCDDAWLLSALPPRSAANWPQPWRDASRPNTTSHHPAPVRTTNTTYPVAHPDLAPRVAPEGVDVANTSTNTGIAPAQIPPAPELAPPDAPPLLPGDRLPTDAECEQIRAVRARTNSLNQTCLETYGPKNTRRAALVKFACGDELTASDQAELAKLSPGASIPSISSALVLDLETPSDRETLAALLRDASAHVIGRPVR